MRFLAISMLSIVALFAQAPQEGGRKGGGQTHKNLKVLTEEQMQAGAMRQFTQALGVQCGYCHVQGNFASDENPKKDVARMMVTMVKDINAKLPASPDAKAKVTCYTCHRGAAAPLTAPPAAQGGL